MKRIVVLIDGTWNEERVGIDTNVAKLSSDNPPNGTPLIPAVAPDGTVQIVKYHEGVGSGTDDAIKHWLGGSIGLGLRDIVLDAYKTVVRNYRPDDDLILCGFSRGAYAVRALAGLIGASGIQLQHDPTMAQAAWNKYRAGPAKAAAAVPSAPVAPERRIKCVAVWDTVGSYGVPAGIGLDAVARFYAQTFLGFHDTTFGDHVEVGLHAVAVDEHRRPFVPTFWTAPKAAPPKGHVEQTWFAGAHSNVGGGEPDAGLSDEALLWMIARLEALTGLAFDHQAVAAATRSENIDGEVNDSTVGWLIDHAFPHLREVLSPDAIDHGALLSTANPDETNINERVHWSVIEKRGRPCKIAGRPDTPYAPPNLPAAIRPDQIATITPEEAVLFNRPQPATGL